ncbi:unnamed protein product [Adineta steineri]|uniref:Alpha-1,4 glucan phosphorylase n=1 Tax=Adineta steineri TaxID=433720 RepID=A0A815KVG5_9BILA|nr:unnamed protein product [Adineta steineri]
MSVGGGQKRRSRSSFVSVRYVPTDEEEELHRQKEAQNLRVSLHQIKNIETILNLVDNFNRHLHLTLMVDRFHSSYQEYYLALSQALRDILAKNWIRTQQFYQMIGGKRVYYLSLEFYIGRYMKNTLINLDINEQMIQAAEALNIKLNDIEELEDDAALGNGGLGRLAACFLDSMATLGISSYGYGLRYQFGIFKQQIVDGWQVEVPDDWLRHSMPWEIRRNQNEIPIHFYGKVIWNESTKSYEWTDYETVIAQAYDYPVPGYKNNIVNTMRLFSAKADCDFNFKSFNEGEYISAVMERNKAERKIFYFIFFSINNYKNRYYMCTLPLKQRFAIRNVILAGVWPGPRKPSRVEMSLFFRNLIDELISLEEGVKFKLYDANDTSIFTRIFLVGACCDKPAQALLQYLPEPIAAFGCGRCEVESI